MLNPVEGREYIGLIMHPMGVELAFGVPVCPNESYATAQVQREAYLKIAQDIRDINPTDSQP